jgi:Carboxypeptidase regulatory-like domain
LSAAITYSCAAIGQQPSSPQNSQLPDAPGLQASASPTNNQTSAGDSATVTGTVMDSNGSEVQDAQVELESLSGGRNRSEQSNSNGEFTFSNLPPGNFKLTVSGQGWGTYDSAEIQLHPGEYHIVPNVILPLTSSAFVRVVGNRDELSEEQVHVAEQQRVLGVFPNFYTSFDWNAPPMAPKQKFQLAFRSITDPVEFAGPAAVAGFEQIANVFPAYGGGAEGYGKRYGAAYANSFTAKLFSDAVYPSLFHQDPRYFYKGSGSFGSRALYAITSAVITRSDSGRTEPNYSYILGTFTSGALSNLYYPPENRGVLLTFTNGLADVAGEAGANLIREFVLNRFTTRATPDSKANPRLKATVN